MIFSVKREEADAHGCWWAARRVCEGRFWDGLQTATSTRAASPDFAPRGEKERTVSDQNYRQCTLTRTKHGVQLQQIAWIPAKFAVVGKFLRLRDEDGWQVISVGGEIEESYILAHKDDHRNAFASLQERAK